MKALAVLLACMCSMAFAKEASFMPPNNLHLEDGLYTGGLTEVQFKNAIDRMEKEYTPIFAKFGAKLDIKRLWSDNTVNASAEQLDEKTWRVNMYGGLARRPEVTEDGFMLVLCHEIGHHLSGYPFVEDWAADEGQSDMYSTGPCAFKMFKKNAELAVQAGSELPADLKAKCDESHKSDADVCYRAIIAGKSLGDLLAALQNTTIAYDTPDKKVVRKTKHSHPDAQCRLDTYVASALCGSEKWDHDLIPGKSFDNRNSLEAQKEAFAHGCETGIGARPLCWFAPIAESEPPAPPPSGGIECPFEDPELCDAMCKRFPKLPWCDK
jgi:hypothetical protein